MAIDTITWVNKETGKRENTFEHDVDLNEYVRDAIEGAIGFIHLLETRNKSVELNLVRR